jgi:hypothetical protein
MFTRRIDILGSIQWHNDTMLLRSWPGLVLHQFAKTQTELHTTFTLYVLELLSNDHSHHPLWIKVINGMRKDKMIIMTMNKVTQPNMHHAWWIWSRSLPLKIEPYQIEDPCPISTSPMTAALGATKTSPRILGSFSKMFMIVRCLETENSKQKGSFFSSTKG